MSRENLGENPSFVAGASLLVDYILTVAVSISAGVAAIISIPEFHSLEKHRVALGLVLILLITLANLRGVKESGRLFAFPDVPLHRDDLGAHRLRPLSSLHRRRHRPRPARPTSKVRSPAGTLSLFLILKGFSSGAVALTGVEAISNGVPAFRRPESRNAANTLVWMAGILGVLFFGISRARAPPRSPYPSEKQTVIAQMGILVFGNGAVFFVLQIATAMILTLAANTAYADFPRLSSIIASDRYLPRQLANRGDRLVFSNGVVFLAGAAGLLLIAFGGVTNALIPLYAVGVFTSFTLSQAGMVRHHRTEQEPGWKRSAVINGIGSVATFVVLIIVAVTKFSSGAWVPIVVIPFIILLFKGIHRHYTRVAESLRGRARLPPAAHEPHRDRPRRPCAQGRARGPGVREVAQSEPPAGRQRRHRRRGAGADRRPSGPSSISTSSSRPSTPRTGSSPGRSSGSWRNSKPATTTTSSRCCIPEFVVKHWWEHILHNQSALILKGRLLFKRGIVVISVPYHTD